MFSNFDAKGLSMIYNVALGSILESRSGLDWSKFSVLNSTGRAETAVEVVLNGNGRYRIVTADRKSVVLTHSGKAHISTAKATWIELWSFVRSSKGGTPNTDTPVKQAARKCYGFRTDRVSECSSTRLLRQYRFQREAWDRIGWGTID